MRSARQCLFDVAVVARNRARRLHAFAESGEKVSASPHLGGAFVPFDLDRVGALLRRPVTFGQNCYALWNPDDLHHAFDLHRCVEGLDLGAKARRARDHAGQHVWHRHVERVNRLAVDLVPNIDSRDGLTDIGPLRRILGLRLRFQRHVLRARGELAEPGALSRRVSEHTVADGDLAFRDVPTFSRGGNQPCTGLGAGLAQLIPGFRHSRRAAGALSLAEQEVVVERRVGRSGFRP